MCTLKTHHLSSEAIQLQACVTTTKIKRTPSQVKFSKHWRNKKGKVCFVEIVQTSHSEQAYMEFMVNVMCGIICRVNIVAITSKNTFGKESRL